MKRFLYGCLLFLTTLNTVLAAQYTLVSSDHSLRGQPKENIKQYLSQLTLKPSDDIGFIKQQVNKQALLAMQAVGYYQGTTDVSIKAADDTIVVDISLGPATLMAQSDLLLIGEGADDPDFLSLKATFPIVVGSKFHHGNFEDNKVRFIQLAQSKGYFSARWLQSDVSIDLVTNSAYLTQTFDSGRRYLFGRTLLPKNHPATALVDAMIPYLVGEAYHSDKLAAFNYALNKSQYFSSAQAIPTAPDSVTGMVDIDVSLIDKPKNIVELSMGYSTDTFERASIKWTKPWINRYGHNLVITSNLSRDERIVTTDYRIPHGDPNIDYTSVVLGWQDIDNTEQDYEKYSLQWQRHQEVGIDWRRTLFLKYEREYDGINTAATNLVIPGISYSRTRRRGGLDTYWGDRQLLTLEMANKSWGSSNDLIKLSIHSNWLRQYNDKHRVLIKLALGAIDASSIEEVPTSLRFFSGGDDNLRAYDFKSIAPLDSNSDGEPVAIGGLFQALASVEYSYPVHQDWRIATFYDIGTTTDDFSQSLKSDAGVGIRWQTVVGPIRLDFAWGLQDHQVAAYDHPFRISFSVGVNL